MSAATAVWVGLALSCAAVTAAARETCFFKGTTDFDGRLDVVEASSTAGGTTKIDVRLELDATPLPLVHTHYVMQEISTWGPTGFEQAAVNDRYRFDGHIVRQQWDIYRRAADGLNAFRVQGKRAGEFRRQHPEFQRFWDPDMFGQPWLAQFPYSPQTRRPDLDSHNDPARVRTPLALAFYWLRWLPRQGTVVPLFLPGFKEQKLVNLAIGPTSERRPDDASEWKAPIEYPYLSPSLPSSALAWLSGDRHVQQLEFDLHGVEHSARGLVQAEGCQSAPDN